MIGRAAIQFMLMLVLARLLSPHEFGVFAMVASVTALALVLADGGLSNALIHFQNVDESERSTLYWLNVAFGATLSVATAAAAPFIALFFSEPRLIELLPLAGLSFVLVAIGQQLRVMAQKSLRFRRLALIEIGAAGLGALVALILAWSGLGAEAIVIGTLASGAFSSLGAWLLLSEGWRPALSLDIGGARRFLSFGADAIGTNLLNALNMNSDVIVGGRLFAPAQLGAYALPRDLCLRLMLVTNPIITRVGLPMLARVQADTARVRHMYRRTVRMTASVNFPLYGALSLFAPDVVSVLFGPNWAQAAPVLQIAAIAALFRSINNPLGSLLFATGETRRSLLMAVIVTLTIFPALAIGAQFGLIGLAWANLFYFATQVVVLWWFAVRPCAGLDFIDYHKQLAAPLIATGIAVCAAALATAPISAMALEGALVRLAIGSVVGAAAYVGASYVLNREWLRSAFELALPGRAALNEERS
jgi:O-antigen/teichoic acid export membrane protein